VSNVKQVHIEFVIDFDFGGCAVAIEPDVTKRAELREPITELQLALFQMTGMPGVGLELGWREAPSRRNAHTGGMCARFLGVIRGHEAFGWGAFDHLRRLLEAVPGTEIKVWDVVDPEDG